MKTILHSLFLLLMSTGCLFAESFFLQGRIENVLPEERSFRVAVTASDSADISVGETLNFRVGKGDLAIGYRDRLIKAKALYYNNAWHLEHIFPIDGVNAKAMRDVNRQLHDLVVSLNRRDYLREGDYVPNFAMIDQNGDFLQIRELRGKAFVLNFIFTRCKVATMCPAATRRMAELQDTARTAELDNLHFVTITFDPEFDSPGILRTYGQGYELESENYHLLTADRALIDDLLRLFGIMTIDEDGTINHTMATLLIDANGRIAFRKEGSTWQVDEFLAKASSL